MSSSPTPPQSPEEGAPVAAAVEPGEEGTPAPPSAHHASPEPNLRAPEDEDAASRARQEEEDDDHYYANEISMDDSSSSSDDDDSTDESGDEAWRDDRAGVPEDEEAAASSKGDGAEKTKTMATCCVCMEPWTSDGKHRICCVVPCGHVYGRSCLERWLRRCGGDSANCPQCGNWYELKDIINLYSSTTNLWHDDCSHHQFIAHVKYQLREMKKMSDDMMEKFNRDMEEIKNLMKDRKVDQIIEFMEKIGWDKISDN
ncbi:hypothetical protein ACP70R_016907 [Stipagrostis hirtigluma subsp. patula]